MQYYIMKTIIIQAGGNGMDNTNPGYKNSSVILDDVPYTISDGGSAKDQAPVGNKQDTASDNSQSFSTYNFSTPNSFGFIKTFQFTSGPIDGLDMKGIGSSLSSLSSLLLPIILLSMVKLLSGANSLLGDHPKQDPGLKVK
jgi:hypothetical protein